MRPNINDLLIKQNSSILEALKLIDNNAQGVCFVISEDKQLVGTLTDGDIRRYLLSNPNLLDSISELVNTNCISLPINASIETIQRNLSQQIKLIPLVDENNIVVDYANVKRLHNIPILEPSLKGKELEYVSECIKTGWISSQGKFVNKFEDMFSEYLDNRPSLAVSNGTSALELALLSLGIEQDDEVIIPNFTFAASANAVINIGATPVFIDISENNWTIDPALIESAITEKTKAIMVVHIYGHPCDMDQILAIANKYNLKIIEDCAESLGSTYKNQLTGTIGDVATFSFFGNKIITTGEGGMVVYKDKDTYEFGKILRDHGMSVTKRYWHDYVGHNYRMTNLQAAIGVAQMEKIDLILNAREKVKVQYDKLLKSNPLFIPQKIEKWATTCNWLYTIKITDEAGISRDELIEKLLKNGIECRPAFYPLHYMPPYRKYNVNNTFPATENVSHLSLSLPTSSSLKSNEINRIVKTLEDLVNIKKLYTA